MNKLAPVAIFTYNRLENTKQVVEALQKNDLASETDVFVFSDAPKSDKQKDSVDKVRSYLKTIKGFKSFTVIERPVNFYIEKNITDGVTDIINRFGKIIVLEDDGVSAKGFLTFMNKALDFYDQYKKVMHVASFTFINMSENYNKTFLWRYSENTGGGWATWKDRWGKFTWFQSEVEGLSGLTENQKKYIELDGVFHCLDNLRLKPIPWDICWNIAIVKNNGLAVNSPYSLIKNNGLYNGTHFTAFNKILGKNPFEVDMHADTDVNKIEFETNIVENNEALDKLKYFYSNLGNRKRDRLMNFFISILVKLHITKFLKKILR